MGVPNPESFLPPENMFGTLIEFRRQLLEQSSSAALRSLRDMEEVHPQREYNKQKLFMSKVAREMDLLASGGSIVSMHDPELAKSALVHDLSPDQVASKQAHYAYVNALYEEAKSAQTEVPEDVQKLHELRNKINTIPTQSIGFGVEFNAQDEQFAMVA